MSEPEQSDDPEPLDRTPLYDGAVDEPAIFNEAIEVEGSLEPDLFFEASGGLTLNVSRAAEADLKRALQARAVPLVLGSAAILYAFKEAF